MVPADFIGVCKSQTPQSIVAAGGHSVSNHDELMSNFFAQPDALACGMNEAELVAAGVPAALRPHKLFPGNRPSSSLLLDALDAASIGTLLALYEHRTAVQGFVWGICSFDQWGVQLGKVRRSSLTSSARRSTRSFARAVARVAQHRAHLSPISSLSRRTHAHSTRARQGARCARAGAARELAHRRRGCVGRLQPGDQRTDGEVPGKKQLSGGFGGVLVNSLDMRRADRSEWRLSI